MDVTKSWDKIDKSWGIRVMSSRNVDLLKVYRSDDSEGLYHHFHNGYEMVYIEQGCSEFIIDHVADQYGPQSLVFINHLEQHRMRPLSTPYVRYVLLVDPDFFDRFVADPVLCSIFKQRPAHFTHGFQLDDADARFTLETIPNKDGPDTTGVQVGQR